MSINVVTAWPTNADLIVDAFTILRAAGLFKQGDSVFDPTYGKGNWWTKFRPTNLTWMSRDLDPKFDFEDIPARDNEFAVTAFDPPYCGKGGRETSGVKAMDVAFGLDDSPKTPKLLLEMNLGGLTECCRITRRAILMKSMDFVTGGELHCHTRRLEDHAETLGWVVYERLVHAPHGGRPQPPNNRDGTPRRELRARQRPSTLTILVPTKLKRGAA